MTTIFTKNDNFVHLGQFWILLFEFAQLYITVILFSSWDKSCVPWANWNKLEHMYTTSDEIFLPARWVSFEAYPKQILAWLSHLWIWSGTFLQTTSKKINRKNFVQHSWKNKHLSKNCQLLCQFHVEIIL